MRAYKNYVLLMALCLSASARADALIPGLNLPVLATAGANGQLDLTQTDIGRLMDRQMVEYFTRQKEDARYFADQLAGLEQLFVQYSNLITAVAPPGMPKTYTDLVNQSQTGNFATAEEFLDVRSRLVAEERAIRSRLGTLRAMNKSALPSARVSVTPTKDVEIPGQFNLDFAPIADYYEEQLNTIGQFLNSRSLSFIDKVGIKVDVRGIDFDPGRVSLITEPERKARQAEILIKRKDAELAWAAQDKLTREIIRGVKQVLELRGVEDRRRVKTESDKAERDAKVRRLGDAFLYHSYLRLKFRQPVGTFYVEYKPLSFNRDQLMYAPMSYVQNFSRNSVRNRNDVEKAVTNFQRAVLAGGMRQSEGNTFFAGALLHGWDFLRGYSTLSKLGYELFQMLYADAREEIQMDNGEGVDAYAQIFKERYLATPESRKHALAVLCAIDRDVACPEGRKSAALGGIETNGSFSGLATEALTQMQGRLNSLKQAADLQRTLDDLTNLPASGFGKKVLGNIDVLKM